MCKKYSLVLEICIFQLLLINGGDFMKLRVVILFLCNTLLVSCSDKVDLSKTYQGDYYYGVVEEVWDNRFTLVPIEIDPEVDIAPRLFFITEATSFINVESLASIEEGYKVKVWVEDVNSDKLVATKVQVPEH